LAQCLDPHQYEPPELKVLRRGLSNGAAPILNSHPEGARCDRPRFIEMLRRLRALPDPDSAAAEPLREVIVLTINGIAAGLRNTG